MPFPLDHYIEASHVDYKERLEEKKPRSWLKSVSAFANTEGGHLIFGVKNEPREVVGLENPQAVVSRLTELIKVRIDPTPRYRVREVEIEGKSCVDLEVQDGPAYPYYYAFDGSHTAYVRHGDQSEEATSRELNELILQGMNQTFDALPSSYRVGDVSFTLLAATFKNLKKEDFDLEKDLPSAGLVTDDGQITNGGLLLCDQGVLKQSRIFCTRWKGNYKGSIEEDALDDKEFQGASLITLLQNAEDFVRNNSKNPWSIRGMTREERSDYPYKAVREVLVNALIHRNYQILGSEIHVEVFDDRLEITSPGAFANIAHGCNSVLATKTALQLADYTVTEAGFGADLGAEKFLDIKRPVLGKTPDAVVIVATVRALEYNGGASLQALKDENLTELENGLQNLNRHIANMQRYGLPLVVAINHFATDTPAEIKLIEDNCKARGVNVVVADAWAKGGAGTLDLAKEVVALAEQEASFTPLYDYQATPKEKVETIATKVYGAGRVAFSKKALNQLKQFEKLGWNDLPICIAKTQYSFTDDQTQLGAPEGFTFHIREFVPKLGAGFIVALAGNMLTMPGLPKVPAAVKMTIDAEGKITGLF